jgi:hypothetical protein
MWLNIFINVHLLVYHVSIKRLKLPSLKNNWWRQSMLERVHIYETAHQNNIRGDVHNLIFYHHRSFEDAVCSWPLSLHFSSLTTSLQTCLVTSRPHEVIFSRHSIYGEFLTSKLYSYVFSSESLLVQQYGVFNLSCDVYCMLWLTTCTLETPYHSRYGLNGSKFDSRKGQ